MKGTVYLNGEYLPAGKAAVSVFDRGFVFGDGVYEVVPVIGGRLVDGPYFIERLRGSLAELSLAWPCSEADYLTVMEELIARNKLQEGIVYSQVTRGVAPRTFTFPPADCPPTFMAYSEEMALLESPHAEAGIGVISTEDIRWKRRDIKSLNLLGQVLAKQAAADAGAEECWMVEDGEVTEGGSSSAYIVKGGTVITRPLSRRILPGIRRRTLLELAEAAGIAVQQRAFTLAEALAADEAFVSSATTLVMSVVSIDGQTIGDGKPGPLGLRLREMYKAHLLQQAGK